MDHALLLDMQCLLLTLALIAPRSAVCLAILPGFGAGVLPMALRGGVALAIGLPAALPTYQALSATPPGMLLSVLLTFKEALVGAMLGVLLALPLWVMQSTGSILDAQRSPIQIASSERDASAIGALLLQATVLVLIEAGLLKALVRILIDSYGAWPAFELSPPFAPGHREVLLTRFGELFWHIVVYGGPVLIPLLLVDFGFAMLGAFAPSLQISFASSPVKSLVGLLMLMLYLPTLTHYVAGDFAHMLDLGASLFQVKR